MSAIDAASGKILWRYKGADKGITNLLLPDRNTIAIADRDDLMMIDVTLGKRVFRTSHKIERASFGLINESGDIVIGGQSEIVAFDQESGRQLWRARHASGPWDTSHGRRDRGSRGVALFSLRRHGDDGVSRRSGGANDQRRAGRDCRRVRRSLTAITRNRVIA